VTANDCAGELRGHNPESANLGIDLSDQELVWFTNLLRLRLDGGTEDFVAKHDAACMKLNATPHV
jgi:hypothetical protein